MAHTYDWQSVLSEHLDKLVGIKSFHHLLFSASYRGHVFAKKRSDGTEVDFNLLKDDWSPSSDELPELLTPTGLVPSRQWYFYRRIREYVDPELQDVTCPLPTVPEPSTASSSRSTTTDAPSRSTATPTPTASTAPCEPPAKRPRLCGVCRKEGHNARSCPSKA